MGYRTGWSLSRTIGWALWRVRDARGKSLQPVAELAGMSKSTLSRIERGERSPTLNEIRALADALQISVSELTRLPVPTPANGHTDSTIAAVNLALMAVSQDLPDGQVLPVEALRARVRATVDVATVDVLCRCEREREVGATLPGLIRDLHASIAASRDVAELLGLSAWLHTQATVAWLSLSAAPVDLRGQAVMKRTPTARAGSPTGPIMARRSPGCGDGTTTR